jgi:hypothetical protein
MGKQLNKEIKRARRQKQIKRKNAAINEKIAAAKKA